MSHTGKRAVILVDNLYQEMEVWYPLYRLQEAGLEVSAAGHEAGKVYTSKHGYPITAAQSIASVRASRRDVLILPGGYAPDRLRTYPEVLQLVREMDEAGRVIAAICHGGWILCSAGGFPGPRATSVHKIRGATTTGGALWGESEIAVSN